MADIVNRLRRHAEKAVGHWEDYTNATDSLVKEAADEIDRLNVQVSQYAYERDLARRERDEAQSPIPPQNHLSEPHAGPPERAVHGLSETSGAKEMRETPSISNSRLVSDSGRPSSKAHSLRELDDRLNAEQADQSRSDSCDLETLARHCVSACYGVTGNLASGFDCLVISKVVGGKLTTFKVFLEDAVFSEVEVVPGHTLSLRPTGPNTQGIGTFHPLSQKHSQVTAEEYNKAFDAANEALGGAFMAGFREGWIYAEIDADGERYQEMAEEYALAVESAPQEAWDANRAEFFTKLPLAALPEVPDNG